MPVEVEWIIQRCAADATSASLRRANRRGMLVMPVEVEWIIKRGAADATSASLRRADLTSRSLQIRWSTFTPASDGISAHKQEADQEGS